MANHKVGKAPDPELLAKEAEVVKYRRGGLTWDMIAEKVGYAHGSGAREAYMRAAARLVADDVEAIRQLETERLDLAQSAIWGKVLQGDNPSIANLLRIMERRAKLLGLDQPTRIQAEVIQYDPSNISEYLQQLTVGLANRPTPSELDSGTGTTESDTAGQ